MSVWILAVVLILLFCGGSVYGGRSGWYSGRNGGLYAGGSVLVLILLIVLLFVGIWS
jgi:hypothetical protein